MRARKHGEVDLRNRAQALGYDLYGLDDGYGLAKRMPGGRRTLVLGKDGGVSLETIERWLSENHPGKSQ